MKDAIVKRVSCGVEYEVCIATGSEIYLNESDADAIVASGLDFSTSDFSSYLRGKCDSYVPIDLVWDMTSKCNFDCSFCYIKDNTCADVSFSRVKNALSDLIELGLYQAYLSGGECLLLKDFIKIYSFLKERGVLVTVFTNASLIDEGIINCWKNLPPSSVEVTLYSSDFSSAPFRNILRLRELGIHVITKFTLTKETIDCFESVKRWCDVNKFELRVDADLFDGNDSSHADIVKRYSLPPTIKKKLIPERYQGIKGPKKVRTGLPCRATRGSVHIAPDFSLSLCHSMKKRWSLDNIAAKEAIHELASFIQKYKDKPMHGCSGCNYARQCGMCFAHAKIVNGELYVPKGYCASIASESAKYL